MGRQAKIKAERGERRERDKLLIDLLSQQAGHMRRVAMDPRNYIDVSGGETLHSKIGWAPDADDPEGEPKRCKLGPHLALSVRLSGWHTHITFMFTMDLVPQAQNDGLLRQLRGSEPVIKRVRHLAVLMHVPGRMTQAEVQAVKDRFIVETFPPEVISLFFPDASAVLTSITTAAAAQDDAGETWTPVVTHFYVDHDGDAVAAPKPDLLDAEGKPVG